MYAVCCGVELIYILCGGGMMLGQFMHDLSVSERSRFPKVEVETGLTNSHPK